MSNTATTITHHRARWAAIGAAVAVSVGAGGLGIANAAVDSGPKPVYQAITPCRLADTRPAPDNVGDKAGPLSAGENWVLDGWGDHGECTGVLPADTTALELNVTAIGATQPTFLTLYPAGAALPTASNLNPAPAQPPTPNAVTAPLAADGTFAVYNGFGFVDVVIDVVGYYVDHNHDDRYYTEAETDAALGALAPGLPDAMAFIDASGTIATGGTNVDSVVWDAALGRYEISFTDLDFYFGHDIAVVTPADINRVVSYGSIGGERLLVYMRDTAGAIAQGDFSFVVWDGVDA